MNMNLMNLIYVPGHVDVIGSPVTAVSVTAVSLAQAITDWASILKSGRYIEARMWGQGDHRGVRIRSSGEIQVSPRDILLAELVEPHLVDVHPIGAGPDVVPMPLLWKGEWSLEINFNSLAALADAVMKNKNEMTFLGVRAAVGSDLVVTTGFGVYEGIFLGIGGGRGGGGRPIDLLSFSTSRSWKIWPVNTSQPLRVVALAREGALNLVIGW